MTLFLEEMKEHFDYIVLDTPPVQAVADSKFFLLRLMELYLLLELGLLKKMMFKILFLH